MTKHPTKNGRYIKLNKNPSGKKEDSYVRKYLRNDPIHTRGELLKSYHLSSVDKKIVYFGGS